MNEFARASQLKAHIGKKVEWEEAHDRHRGTCLVRTGRLEGVEGRNLIISGDYKWFPTLRATLKVIEEAPQPPEKTNP